MKQAEKKQAKGTGDDADGGKKPHPSATQVAEELMKEALEAMGAPEPPPDGEEIAIVEEPAGGDDARAELAAGMERLLRENAELKDRALRAQADLENFRKRALREKDDFQKFAVEGLLRDLLPVADNVDQAMAHIGSSDLPTVRTGVEMTYKSFLDALKKKGVAPFESKGEPFDPNIHEAVQMLPSAEVPVGRVVAEVRRGYMIHDRLLRAAMVVVSTGAPKAADGGADGGDGGPAGEA